MNPVLNEVEARVLAALLEKEITTPDYYPLSLNALVNACNQKSNRDPVMNVDEDSVRSALRVLHDNSLARSVSAADSRVTKYEHRLQEAFNFDRREASIFCELLLRGPQTPGELRSRAERMHNFDDLGEVQSALQRLMNRQPPLVKVLARQPGTKESRYVHLLSGDVEPVSSSGVHEVPAVTGRESAERLSRLESEVAELRMDIADLKQQFAAFRKQFE
ncbi:MAG TPA: YceH family protein [Candidatus Acidoferrum sp.]|nr:YceH family protein [Candidatus Acidoferrum sp.]